VQNNRSKSLSEDVTATRREDIMVSNKMFLLVPIDEAAILITERIKVGRALIKIQVDDTFALEALKRDYKKWDDYNIDMLKTIFENGSIISDYKWSIMELGVINEADLRFDVKLIRQQKKIELKIEIMESLVERL